ncbi:MAG: hypothetical protein QXF45_04755 [Candidatus Caldarchaeum sp.]
MTVLFAATDETGIPAAVKLAKNGIKVLFYTPNPYTETRASNYHPHLHRFVSKTEFIKLHTSQLFRVVSKPEEFVEEIWLHVNTFKDGKDEYRSAENLAKLVGEIVAEARALTVAGMTKVGEAANILATFNKRSEISPEIQQYIGGPSVFQSCVPAWKAGGKISEAVSRLTGVFFDDVETAEIATLSQLFSQAAYAEVMVEMATYHHHQQLITKCVAGDTLIYPETLDALKYYHVRSIAPMVDKLLTRLKRTALKSERLAAAEISEMAKRARRQLRILFIGTSEQNYRRLTNNIKGKNVKIQYVNENDVSVETLDSLKGFQGVLVNSLRLDLFREISVRFERVWFVPCV